MKQIPSQEPKPPMETAAYIAAFTRDLARLAREQNLLLLAYLLDMAHLEAENVAGANLGVEAEASGRRR